MADVSRDGGRAHHDQSAEEVGAAAGGSRISKRDPGLRAGFIARKRLLGFVSHPHLSRPDVSVTPGGRGPIRPRPGCSSFRCQRTDGQYPVVSLASKSPGAGGESTGYGDRSTQAIREVRLEEVKDVPYNKTYGYDSCKADPPSRAASRSPRAGPRHRRRLDRYSPRRIHRVATPRAYYEASGRSPQSQHG